MIKMPRTQLRNNLVIFVLFFLFTLLFYGDAFKHFFYQDDIWHFYISNAKSLKEVFEFFNPINKFDYQTYRPLSTQLLFFSMQKLFGINHFVFQFLALLLLSVNTMLIFTILKKYTKNGLAFLLGIFYLVHHQNIGIVYYLSTIQISIALFFTLLSIREIQIRHKFWQGKIFVFYLLALLSQEIILLNPVIFAILIWLEDRKVLKTSKKLLIALLTLMLVYLASRFYFVNQELFANTHYQISLQPKTIANSLFWYGLWALSVPEYLINFVGSGFQPLPPLFGQYKNETTLSLIILASNIVVFISLFFNLVQRQQKKQKYQLLIYLLCFVFALTPILIFPWHKYVYYLPIAMVFILLFLSHSLAKIKHQALAYLMLILLIGAAITTNFIDRKTSYNYKRGVLAENFRQHIDWSVMKKGSKTVLITNDPTFTVFSDAWGSTSSQAKIIFKDNLFFTVLSQNPEIKVIYEDDLQSLKNLNYDYQIMAKKEW